MDIALDAAGNTYVAGGTTSPNFPGATPRATTSDAAFVTKLNAAGQLVYSTYLLETDERGATGIAVDPMGNAYVTGRTSLWRATASNDVFVAKLDAFGRVLRPSGYFVTFGGNLIDWGNRIAVDCAGNAYVTGVTEGGSFPTTPGAFRRVPAGEKDAFVTKLNAAGTSFIYSTLLGGGGDDAANDIALDALGNVYVTGSTESINFPVTAAAFQRVHRGCDTTWSVMCEKTAFVTKVNPWGTGLVYSTYLGGSGTDQESYAEGIAIDGAGNAYVTGATTADNFPTTAGVIQPKAGYPLCYYEVCTDAFVTKLNAAGSALVYSTYLMGAAQDFANGIAVDSAGNAYIAGGTSSGSSFPIVNAFQPRAGSFEDAFVAKLNANASQLVYSSYLGGAGTAHAYAGSSAATAIAVDASGRAHVTGMTYAKNFPTSTGAAQRVAGACSDTYFGCSDAFVTRIAASGPGVAQATSVSMTSATAVAGGYHQRDVVGDSGPIDVGHACISIRSALTTSPTRSGAAGIPRVLRTARFWLWLPPGRSTPAGTSSGSGRATTSTGRSPEAVRSRSPCGDPGGPAEPTQAVCAGPRFGRTIRPARLDDRVARSRPRATRSDHAPSNRSSRSSAKTPSVVSPALRLNLLGAASWSRGNARAVALERRDAGVLAYLAIEGQTPRARLLELLWPDAERDVAPQSLPAATAPAEKGRWHRIGRGCRDAVAGGRPSPSMHATWRRPQQQASCCRDSSSATALSSIRWLAQQRARMFRAHFDALAAHASQLESEGQFAEAIALAEQLVALAPLEEHAHRRLMRLHYLRNDRSGAIAAFERCERLIKDEFGARPSERDARASEDDRKRRGRRRGDRSSVRPAVDHPAATDDRPRRPSWQPWSQRGTTAASRSCSGRAALGSLACSRNCLPNSTAMSSFARVREIRPRRIRCWRVGCGPSTIVTRRRWRRRVPKCSRPYCRSAPCRPARRRSRRRRFAPPANVCSLRHSQGGLTACIVDDLHCADAASLELFPHLMLADSVERLSLGAGTPPGGRRRGCGQPRRRACRDLIGSSSSNSLRSTKRGSPSWSTRWRLPDVVGERLATPLARHTGGNPLFVLETLKQAVLGGGFDGGRLPRPLGVIESIERRLAGLSAQAQSLVQVAAVAGADFSVRLAEAVLATTALSLAEAWRELEAAQLIDGEAFVHDLVHEAVLGWVPQPIRRHLYGAVACFLGERGRRAGKDRRSLARGRRRRACGAGAHRGGRRGTPRGPLPGGRATKRAGRTRLRSPRTRRAGIRAAVSRVRRSFDDGSLAFGLRAPRPRAQPAGAQRRAAGDGRDRACAGRQPGGRLECDGNGAR